MNYPIRLSLEERESLQAIISKGKSSTRAIRRAQLLLTADENRPSGVLKEQEIVEKMQKHANSVYAIRKTYMKQGWEAAIGRKQRVMPPVAPNDRGK